MKNSSGIQVSTDDRLKFQLERNGLDEIPYEITLLCSSKVAEAVVYGSFDWEEISR